jgi:hypothetical protein
LYDDILQTLLPPLRRNVASQLIVPRRSGKMRLGGENAVLAPGFVGRRECFEFLFDFDLACC